MVEIFKTNVEDTSQAEKIIGLINQQYPCFAVNFDLQDCDKILRVKGDLIPISEIEQLVSAIGFYCTVLN